MAGAAQTECGQGGDRMIANGDGDGWRFRIRQQPEAVARSIAHRRLGE